MQGMVDNDGGVTGRFNHSYSDRNTLKLSVQVCLFFLNAYDPLRFVDLDGNMR